MTRAYTPLITKEDLKLAEDILRNGPRVTIRRIQRRQAIFPTSDAVRRCLEKFVRAGLGLWMYEPMSPAGGRQRQSFILTASKSEVQQMIDLLHQSLKSQLSTQRCIYKDLQVLLNKYRHRPSAELARIFSSATDSLNRAVNPELDDMPRQYSVGPRHFAIHYGDD